MRVLSCVPSNACVIPCPVLFVQAGSAGTVIVARDSPGEERVRRGYQDEKVPVLAHGFLVLGFCLFILFTTKEYWE